jgi:ribosomal protein L11 methyltransferase
VAQAVLWRVTIQTSREAEEAVAELLTDICGTPVSSYFDFENQTVTVSAYFEHAPSQWVRWKPRIERELRELDSNFLSRRESRVSLTRMRRQDWANSWKLHFKTLLIGKTLVVNPPWDKTKPAAGHKSVVIDPGLSFGTGQHPTTLFCLHEIVRFRREGQSQSFLDVGTGSGILAVAAAKLGFTPVMGFDFDPVAVRSARQNAARNRLAHGIIFKQGELTAMKTFKARYDLICANVTSDLLIANCGKLGTWLNEGGRLVLAGILDSEFAKVELTFRELGLYLKRTKKLKEWRSGSFGGEDNFARRHRPNPGEKR